MYTCKKTTAFPEPTFDKFINTQQHHEQISYTKFHVNHMTSVESTDRT